MTRNFFRSTTRAESMTEYGLVIASAAIAVLITLTLVGGQVGNVYSNVVAAFVTNGESAAANPAMTVGPAPATVTFAGSYATTTQAVSIQNTSDAAWQLDWVMTDGSASSNHYTLTSGCAPGVGSNPGTPIRLNPGQSCVVNVSYVYVQGALNYYPFNLQIISTSGVGTPNGNGKYTENLPTDNTGFCNATLATSGATTGQKTISWTGLVGYNGVSVNGVELDLKTGAPGYGTAVTYAQLTGNPGTYTFTGLTSGQSYQVTLLADNTPFSGADKATVGTITFTAP